jgi:hypothetical protein
MRSPPIIEEMYNTCARWDAEPAPALGSCIGCGYCCTVAPCSLVWEHHLLESLKPGWSGCPSLVFKDGRHWCGVLLKAEGKEMIKVMAELFIGAGCCSQLNSWRREPIVDRR